MRHQFEIQEPKSRWRIQLAIQTLNIRSILVVDDDQYTLEAMRRVLKPSGYDVFFAFGGRDAIRLLTLAPVDLVITDILMSDGDGLELIGTLHKTFANVSILAMSGGGKVRADDYLLMARGFGADGILRKPFTRDELLKAVKAVEARRPASANPFNT